MAESNQGPSGFLSGISGFDRSNLRATTTTERSGPVIPKSKNSTRRGFADDEDITAYYDTPDELRRKCKELATLIKNSKSVVVYTGAGISTSAGLPDYRSEETGVWTMIDKGLKPMSMAIDKVVPSFGHMALCALYKHGLVSYVVSTNVDGLHLRSGLPRDKLSELHGNAYLERCLKCNKEYLRNFDVCTRGYQADHKTGRICEVEGCGGELADTIINFGENLPETEYQNAENASRQGDLALVLGTSMRVAPANTLPSFITKMVICNLQKTPCDKRADLRIQGFVDDILALVVKELGIEVNLTISENISVRNWTDKIDEVYPEKIVEMKKKLEELKSKIPPKLSSEATINSAVIASRTTHTVENINGDTKIVNDVAHLKQLIYVKKCKNSNIVLPKMSSKIVVDSCEDCIIDVQSSVLTSVLEVINCKNVTVNIDVAVYTVTVDGCKGVQISYKNINFFSMIISTKTIDTKLKVNGEVYDIKHDPNSDNDLDQYITRFIKGKILTEFIIRENEGMFTTEREKAEQAEESRLRVEMMKRYKQNY